ncbi:MAG: DUF1552 domain-containing protein [Myxococcota bacterium]
MNSRRDLLRAIGAGAFLCPFLPFGGEARAATGRPQNLLLIYHPNGLESGWEPVGTETSFTLSPTLQALERHRERLVFVSGTRGGITNEILAHNQGMVSMWTGSSIEGAEGFAQHRSIDQIAADTLSVGTPVRSLELGVQALSSGISNSTVMCYAAPDIPLPAEDDPDAAFSRLFEASTSDPAAAKQRRAERGSVLDLVKDRLAKVRPIYGTADQNRLDAHLDAIRNIERRLDGLSTLTCEVEPSPHGLTRSQLLTAGEFFGDIAALQTDLIAAAFTCGATRVASLQLSHSTSATELPGLGLPAVHTVMHTGTGPEKQSINAWFVGQLASLLDTFSAMPGSAGGSLLDETLVVWNTEMAVGNHLNERIPVILGGGGVFPGNRFVAFEEPPRHTRMLVSMLRGLGIEEVDALGDFGDDRGPIEELWA